MKSDTDKAPRGAPAIDMMPPDKTGEPTDRRLSRPLKDALLTVIVPCFNEQDVIRLTQEHLVETLGRDRPFALEILYVNDGSSDRTGEILADLADSDPRVKVVSLSRNFGHQPAVSAGFSYAGGDVVAVIDADLQDPPAVILQMLDKWQDGFDVVYGVRAKRKEGLFKRFAYAAFYRILKSAADMESPLDAGDFSLLDRKVVDVMNSLPEKNRFVRGLRAWTGFRQTGVIYERAPRAAGETKYPLRKLIKLAFDGIVNFSTAPLSVVFGVGMAVAVLAMFGLVFVVAQRIFNFPVMGVWPEDVPGFAALSLMILFIGGVQLVSVGILGEYIGRIYIEVKQRPTFLVKSVYKGQGIDRDTPEADPEMRKDQA